MLFCEFFPRLRDRAWEQYGQTVTERQFKDWREDGLLPGPSAPRGRGRGRSPERHWPVASYRRALRICRYKFWGANRQSQWWLGFWLSGEGVEPSIIREALKREFSIERRKKHAFIGSERWRNSEFHTIDDAERGGVVGGGSVRTMLKLMKLTPDQYRRIAILELDEFSNTDAATLMHEIAPVLFNIDSQTAAEIRADIAPDELQRLWRVGHMAEGSNRPRECLDQLPDSDFEICLNISKERERSAVLNYVMLWLLGYRSPERVAFNLMSLLAIRANSIQYRIAQLVSISFEVAADIDDGFEPTRRYVDAVESNEYLKSFIQKIGLERRQDLLH